MTCTVYLVRHAIAERVSANGQDADRQLTPEGFAKLRKAAHGLAWLGVVPDELRCSPFQRTQQTAALLGAVLAPKLSIKPCHELAPGHSPDEVMAALLPNPSSQTVMLVGHEPDLSRLASYILTGSPDVVPMPFKKGSVAAIEVPSLAPRSLGRLAWFATPKQLRALGELVTRPRAKTPP